MLSEAALPDVTRVRARGRYFFLGMALLCAVVVFVGFAPTYYLRGFSDRPPLTRLVRLHGFVFSAWILLFVVQSALVKAGRRDLHRRIGVAGAVLALPMVWFGAAVALNDTAARLAAGKLALGLPPLQFLALQLLDLLQFIVFVGLAVAWRRHPETHKRLMMLATLSLIAPAIGRLPLPPLWKFTLPVLAVVGCMLYDLIRQRRVHPAFLWGGTAFILDTPLRFAIGKTPLWHDLAQWLVIATRG